jgi:Sulfatase
VRRVGWWVATIGSGLLVLLALVVPNQWSQFTAGAFLRVPVEALVGIVVLTLLPERPRRIVALVAGAALGVLLLGKLIDLGFYRVLDRPFNAVFDWPLLADAVEFLRRSIGRLGTAAAVVVALLLVVAVVGLMALAVLRLSRLVAGHRTVALRTTAVAGLVWVLLAALGAQIVAGAPVASWSASALAADRLGQLPANLRDERAFAAASAVDAFRDTPGANLLTALRGKDVIVVFVEAYGRVALEDPRLSPGVGAVLAGGDRRLAAAGFAARSGWLVSPTFGGGSWLAHSTLMSGLWVNNEERYRTLLASDRFTLNGAFHRAGWRTVGVQPAVREPWPEGQAFYGFDRLYTAPDLGYRGPLFTFGSMPDQYTLSAFQRAERATPGHPPVMAEIVLLSSHLPWAPVPPLVDWDRLGDGTVYDGTAGDGLSPDAALRDADRAVPAYGRSVEYSLDALVSYVEHSGDDNLVLVMLGDHQPASVVAGEKARRDVPISIVARDRGVLDRVSSWGWQDGLRPAPDGPVWRMDTFRDRFLTAYGP